VNTHHLDLPVLVALEKAVGLCHVFVWGFQLLVASRDCPKGGRDMGGDVSAIAREPSRNFFQAFVA